MWKCKNCSEQVESNFDVCWNCGYSRNGSAPSNSENVSTEDFLPTGELLSTLATTKNNSQSKSAVTEALTRRYTDAYLSARWLIRIGSIIKGVAIVLAIMIIVIVGVSNIGGNSGFLLSTISGVAIGLPGFIFGILISGQGQTQLATLDTAVNTSRFLSKEDVAGIIFG